MAKHVSHGVGRKAQNQPLPTHMLQTTCAFRRNMYAFLVAYSDVQMYAQSFNSPILPKVQAGGATLPPALHMFRPRPHNVCTGLNMKHKNVIASY